MTDEHIPSSNDLARQRTDLADTRTHLADERTSLAVARTMAAHDRTLMAWIRTSTSLISFGFTIYKFFQALDADRPEVSADRLLGPRGTALVLIALGVGGLVAATLDYRTQVRALRERYRAYGPFQRSKAAAVAAIISGLGILGFVLVFLRQ